MKSKGIGIGGMLGIVFVTLKLCGVINWSWWWVTCPFWAPIAIGGAFAAVAFLFATFISAVIVAVGWFSK